MFIYVNVYLQDTIKNAIFDISMTLFSPYLLS